METRCKATFTKSFERVGYGMRTQKEIEIDNLQKHIRNAYQLAKYMGNTKCAELLEAAFYETNA